MISSHVQLNNNTNGMKYYVLVVITEIRLGARKRGRERQENELKFTYWKLNEWLGNTWLKV